MAHLHEYPVTVDWQGGRGGQGKAKDDRSGIAVDLAAPPEFGGSGNGTNPEEMTTMAVAACYSITYGIIAEMRKLPFLGIETKAVGEVEENGPQFTYKKVTLRPVIRLAADATPEQVEMAEQMSHKADAYCIITNALKGKVEFVVEPTIVQ